MVYILKNYLKASGHYDAEPELRECRSEGRSLFKKKTILNPDF